MAESVTTSGGISRRYFDPYGQPVGTVPAWPDNHNYLGKPQDPVFQPGSRLAMGGYAYADDNPATSADPTGLCITNGDICQKNPSTGSYGSGSGGALDRSFDCVIRELRSLDSDLEEIRFARLRDEQRPAAILRLDPVRESVVAALAVLAKIP